jgi:Protein required for attachment to host cells
LETLVLEHARVGDTVTDLAGRRAAPTQKNWGATLGDNHHLQLESRRRLIRQIAGHIQRLVQSADSNDCWLAAHPEICHQVLAQLTVPTRNRIKKVIHGDLTKARQKELLAKFLNPNSWRMAS